MASFQAIGKGQALAAVLEKIFGEKPSLRYEEKRIVVYFEPDRLKRVQQKIESMAMSAPGDVVLDWQQIAAPSVLKRAMPIGIVILAIGFLLGKKI